MSSIGQRLVKLRKLKNLNQKEAAKLIGTTNTNLSRYESNKRVPNESMLSLLADFYHVHPSYIMFGEDRHYLNFLSDVTEEEARLLNEYLKEIRKKT